MISDILYIHERDKFIPCKDDNMHGKVSLMLLFPTSMNSNDPQLSKDLGILPSKVLLLRLKCISLQSTEKLSRIMPLRLFCPIWNMVMF